ncbi:sigma-70 family RNA polymerase sigma factor [Enterococcus sp. AZ072]|uniref:sigma-70 family RNA polymerase sigma factor n=1 Tax=unclassified Enterococcus TaxID=2608891 RepID=UPI003D2E3C54
MQNEKKITYEFISYINQAMIHEKIKYIQKSDKKRHARNGIKVINDETLIQDLVYSDEDAKDISPVYNTDALEEKYDYENLEDYISDEDLAAAIKKLTSKEKLILFMKYVEGKKDTEISKEFGISSQAVSKRKLGILKKLKLQVRKE